MVYRLLHSASTIQADYNVLHRSYGFHAISTTPPYRKLVSTSEDGILKQIWLTGLCCRFARRGLSGPYSGSGSLWNQLLVVTDVASPKSPWDDPLGIHWCPLAHKLVHQDRYHPRPHSVAGAATGVFSIWALAEKL